MIARNHLPNPRCKYAILPSSQMIIRRYRSIEKQRDLYTFFEEGLFFKQLTEFDDDNEGVVENFQRESTFRGALAAASYRKRQRLDEDVDTASDEEFVEGAKEYHKNARKQHFANCWRMGTDEDDDIWGRYTRSPNLVEGCAIETTVGEFLSSLLWEPIDPDDNNPASGLTETPEWDLAIENPNCDIKVGACRYQQRWKDESLQPAGWPATVSFFKGEDFDIEKEFRLVFNPFSPNIQVDFDAKGIPQAKDPNVSQIWRKFIAATKWMANRIIMAPNSGAKQREKVEKWVEDFGIETGDDPDADLEIVESSSCVSQTSTHEYLAEIGGQDNYDGSDQYLSEVADEFLAKRDWQEWPIVDIVLLLREEAGALVEGYWYQDEKSAFQLSEYGHEFQNVWAARFKNGGDDYETWRNENAREYDKEQGTRTLSFSDID